MSRINDAVTQIGTQLAERALQVRGGLGQAEVGKIVDAAVADLKPAERHAVHDSFARQLERFGDSYFASVFGTDKSVLLRSLDKSAADLPAPGASSVLGYLNAHAACDFGASSAGPVPEPQPYIPPDESKKLKANNAFRMLGEIASDHPGFDIYMHRDLPPADKLTEDDARFILQHRVNDLRLEGDVDNGFTVAARTYDDSVSDAQVVAAMKFFAEPYGTDFRTNRGDWDHSIPSGHDDDVVAPATVKAKGSVSDWYKANNAVRQVNEIMGMVPGFDIYVHRDLPPANKMTEDDKMFVIQHRLNDVRLEQADDGTYSVAGRTYDDSVSDAQVAAALGEFTHWYGVEVRVNRGDWAFDQPELQKPDGPEPIPQLEAEVLE